MQVSRWSLTCISPTDHGTKRCTRCPEQMHHVLPICTCFQRHVKPFISFPYSRYHALLGSQVNTITLAHPDGPCMQKYERFGEHRFHGLEHDSKMRLFKSYSLITSTLRGYEASRKTLKQKATTPFFLNSHAFKGMWNLYIVSVSCILHLVRLPGQYHDTMIRNIIRDTLILGLSIQFIQRMRNGLNPTSNIFVRHSRYRWN